MKKFESLFIFFAFWLITLAFYFKTRGAGFVTDEIGWLQSYKEIGWRGIFNAFNDKSLHYVYHLFGYALWKLFGLNGFGWMMAFVALHAAVATASYKVFKEIFSFTEVPSSSLAAFAGSLLFVVSPYQTEPMVWYACIHYLVCSFFLFLAFRFLLIYLREKRKRFIAAFYLCFFPALFTLEISFTFPVILFLFFLFGPERIFRNAGRIAPVKIFVLPSLGLLICYLLLSSILRGSMVGHYGAAQHLNFNIPLITGNFAKYISKIFFLTQFASFDKRHALYSIFEKEKFGWLLFFLLTLSAIAYVIFHGRMNAKFRLLFLLFGFFLIALLPILNLYFSYIVNVEGDRFTYFASAFAYQLLAVTAFVLFRKWGWVVISAFLFFQIKFLLVNTESWSHSGLIQASLIEKFKWYDAKKIYLLNIPDNFRGTYMYRSFPPDNYFARTLALRDGKNIEERTSEVLEYNMDSISDSVRVEKISNTELKVSFAQPGNWWWRNGIGADHVIADHFEVKPDEGSYSYSLVFKDKLPGSVYLYQCAGNWREVKDF
jgi:hypothetical protein